MFLGIDNQPKERIALIDDSKESISFGTLQAKSFDFYSSINKRATIFILSDNSIESFVAYYSCLDNKVIPLLLNSTINLELLGNLIDRYRPEYLFVPAARVNELNFVAIKGFGSFVLLSSGFPSVPLYEDLAMLLPTSGSTGSPKLVRHTYENLEFSALSVSDFFSISSDDVAIAFLPMYYTMGLSVINSHLLKGAKVVLTNLSLTDRGFWEVMKNEKVSIFTGVPYSFEILDKLRFYRMNLPDLKVITQGGGKLRETLFEKFAAFALEKGMKFIPTYGQTEGSARMAYLSHDKVIEKNGSIGRPIPGGYLGVIDEDGNEITPDSSEAIGEMIYKGKNVTLGYADTYQDLIRGDDNHGILYTGDIVRRDVEGYFFIVGRKKRFLKIFGLRVSLDEIESLVSSHFDFDCVCAGTDDKLMVWITNQEMLEEAKNFISTKTGLFRGVIEVGFKAEIQRNDLGKVILTDLN
jgi:long-chain acyl-CoA synthetase